MKVGSKMITRRYGKSQIKTKKSTNKNMPGIRKTAGGSYTDRSSVIHLVKVKNPSKKLNLIATICLDPDNPVPGFYFSEAYVDGVIFSHYIDKLRFPRLVKYDMIDGASYHKAKDSNIRRKKVPVEECYENKEIIPDFVPHGYPEFNPIEQLFGWLKQYLRNQSIHYVRDGKWDYEDMKKVLLEAKAKVTHGMVKAWYRNSFRYVHPGALLPKYLPADMIFKIK